MLIIAQNLNYDGCYTRKMPFYPLFGDPPGVSDLPREPCFGESFMKGERVDRVLGLLVLPPLDQEPGA